MIDLNYEVLKKMRSRMAEKKMGPIFTATFSTIKTSLLSFPYLSQVLAVLLQTSPSSTEVHHYAPVY